MSKKIIILSVIVLVLAILFLYKFTIQTTTSYEISGQIETVKDGESTIVVFGTVKLSDSKDMRREKVTIEFEINSTTVLKTRKIIITKDQIESGQQFAPETQEQLGVASDLVAGIVVLIKSRDNLFITDKAVADEINYISYDVELPKQ